MPDLASRRILLVVTGGIAAYKALELIRLLRKSGASVRAVLTKAGAEFVTALSVGALTEDKVYTDLWSLTDEAEMGHIRLSREADLIVIAPASADLLAKMANGLADDLASTMLLAADKPILIAPAMNVRMWEHPATIANIATLESRGVIKVGPDPGPIYAIVTQATLGAAPWRAHDPSPVTRSETSRMPSSDCSRPSSRSLARRLNSRPTAVRSTLRVVRWNSRTPSASSSFSMRRDSAGCERCSSSDAARKLLSLATATKARKSARSKFIVPPVFKEGRSIL